MDLWRLNIFCKVVEQKSFSKAGKIVHLSQPTVSSHIKDLEDHFGCRLIDRLSKEALPTKAGEILYRYARKFISLRDEAETAIAEFQGQIKGRLVIGCSTIPGTYLLPRMIGVFLDMYPAVTASIAVADTERIIHEMLDGKFEIGIVGARSDDKRIIQDKWLEDQLCLIVPGGHKWAGRKKIRPSKLIGESFIVRHQGSGTFKAFAQSLVDEGMRIDELSIVAELGSTEAVCQAIKGGVGISVLSPRAVREELAAGTLRAILIEGLNLSRSFYLTRHKYRSLPPPADRFIQFLKKEAANTA